MSEEGIDQPAPSKPALRHTTQGGRLTVTRKAPLPPKLSLNETSALTVRYVNGKEIFKSILLLQQWQFCRCYF
jgi:hypothetical protein